MDLFLPPDFANPEFYMLQDFSNSNRESGMLELCISRTGGKDEVPLLRLATKFATDMEFVL